MDAGKARLPTELKAFGKLGLGLTGKTDDDIRSDGGIRSGLPDKRNRPPVIPYCVAAAHTLKHRLAAALQRKVKVAA